MKLPNGYGSVYKKSGKRKKPYVVIVTTGWKEESQIRKIIGYTETRKEGLEMLAKYHNNPYNLDYKNLTFDDVWQKVIANIEELVKNDKMSESNYRCLSLAYKNHCKKLYKVKLLDTKYIFLQDVVDNVEAGYTMKGYVKTICRKVFDYAINILDMPIIRDPTDRLVVGEKPNSDKHIPFEKNEIEILWGLQYNDLVKIFLIDLYCGARPNEIFITHKDNIFLEENYFITGSKTESGKDRIIPIHPKIKHLIKYFSNKDEEYPFKTIFDKFNYNKFSRESVKLMEELNFNHTPYDCRHTFITKMKKAGANEYILKLIVGHKIKDITERTYTHRNIQELYEEIKKIN